MNSRARRPEFVAEAVDGFAVDLGDARLGFADGSGDSRHGPILEVIENQDVGLIMRELGNHPAKFGAGFVLVADGVRPGFGVVGHGFPDSRGFAVLGRFKVDLLTVLHGLGELVKSVQVHAHGVGNLFAAGLASEAGFESAGGVVEFLLAGAEMPGGPVEFAEAVKDGPRDADAGVLAERQIAAGTEAPGSIDEADGASLDQVLQLHGGGKAALNGTSDLLDVLHVSENKFLLLLFEFSEFAASLSLLLAGGRRLRRWERNELERKWLGGNGSAGHRPSFPRRGLPGGSGR